MSAALSLPPVLPTPAPVGLKKIAPVLVTLAVMRRWTRSPLAFALEALKFEPDAWQHLVLMLVETSPRAGLRIAMMACKGPGKSAILAVLILWFLFTRPCCKIIVTSITGKNLEDGLWAELSKWGGPLDGAFQFDKKRIVHKQYPERWFVSFRTWPKDGNAQAQADSLAGPHEDYIMFVLDEVSEYPEGVVAAAEASLSTGKEMILLAAGNCTRTTGSPLYRFATQDSWSPSNTDGWHIIKVTGDPDNPLRSKRVNEAWARNLIRLWGRDHPIVRTNVLAEFPLAGSGALLTLSDIEAAMNRNPPRQQWEGATKIIGVDVARFGIDKSIYFPRQGPVAFLPHAYPYVDRNFNNQAADLRQLEDRFETDGTIIEVNGLGVGLWDACERIGKTAGVTRLAVNTVTTEGVDPRYHNMRAQMHFTAAQWVKDGGSLPDVPEIVAEATAPVYDFNKQTGRIIIGDKDDIKELIGRSPDYWDAFCMTHTYPIRSNLTRRMRGLLGDKRRADYNPFVKERRS